MNAPSQQSFSFFLWIGVATLVPFVCLPVLQHLIAEAPLRAPPRELLIFLGSSVHVAASLFFFADQQTRRFMGSNPGRFVIAPIALIAGTTALYAFSDREVLVYFVIAYWIWQTHHYTRQNHGILAFANRAHGLSVSTAERTAITMTGIAGEIGMITFVTPYRETLLADFGWHLHAIALGVYVASWLFFAAALLRRRSPPRLLFIQLLLMVFYLPLFLFSDAMSAVTTYAMAHGLQYLVFMWTVAGVPVELRGRRLLCLAACGILGGLLLHTIARAPGSLGHWRQIMFGAYLGLIMWHFLLDAGMWRLSEPFQRNYMTRRFRFLQGSES